MTNIHGQAIIYLEQKEREHIRTLRRYRSKCESLGEVRHMCVEDKIYRDNMLDTATYVVQIIRQLRRSINFLKEQN